MMHITPFPDEGLIPDAAGNPERTRLAVSRAHDVLLRRGAGGLPDEVWRSFLRRSAQPDVLEALDTAARHAWAQDAACLLAHLRCTLGDLLDERTEECGDAVFLESLAERRTLTFSESRARIRRIAAAFHAVDPAPRVLIFAANSIETALCDLACLCHGILVAPVSVHAGAEELAWMIRRLGITIAVTDSPERLATLAAAGSAQVQPPRIIATDRERVEKDRNVLHLDDLVAEFGHRPLPATEVDPFATATVMFTSGSTGRPKGVCFSQHAMLTKRFARAAALPSVGRGETLLAYLPLFHTFGRFLELQGMLFWRGRYVFAQDGSQEALLAGLRTVQPTGLIGVPLRWSQLADAAMAGMHGLGGEEARAAFRDLCGRALRWGVSAAGYLDPNVFHFFQSLGVELCSGFGMTEATGGILMTPPGAYETGTVGVPLPCVEVRLAGDSELQIRGPYVARVLDETGDLPAAAPSAQPADHPWFATGDVFSQRASGQFEIVDRLKDIYKNSRGQTVSPLGIENLYRDIPGIRRVFVVGDGREYNVLLVVPDPSHPLFAVPCDEEKRDAWMREIIRAANAQIAPFERVVRYALLDRDFEMDKGEITPKGSYNRGAVARSFAAVIAELYQSRIVTFTHDGLMLRIPHWLLRELGVTVRDLACDDARGVVNKAAGTALLVSKGRGNGTWIIGDLEYCCPGGIADLGILCRQPLGWVGNPALTAMFPCREGWDAVLPPGMAVRATGRRADRTGTPSEPAMLAGVSARLRGIHDLLSEVLHDDPAVAVTLIDHVAMELDHGGRNIGNVVRARLGALAWHGDLRLRCAAYAALLLYDPAPEHSGAYTEFVRSGHPFLSSESIRSIAARDLREGGLSALRARLQRYRDEGAFDDTTGTAVAISLLELLVGLAENDPAYVFEVRAELCHWMRHEAMHGRRRFGSDTMFERLRNHYAARYADWARTDADRAFLRSALRFDDGIAAWEQEHLASLFTDTPFLPLSLLMLRAIPAFSASQLAEGGVWISALPDFGAAARYLVSITTRDEQHHQMQIMVHLDMSRPDVLATMHLFIALSGAASGPRVLPRFGSFMPDAGAVSMQHVRGSTVWDDLLRLASGTDHPAELSRRLRTLLVRGMAAFITAWQQSGRTIIPGAAHPANVTVPEEWTRGGAVIHSIDGWTPCEGSPELLHALRRHFFAMTSAHMPEMHALLDPAWICEAAREALGDAEGTAFIEAFLRDDAGNDAELCAAAERWLGAMHAGWIAPLALDTAVACYREWQAPHAASALGLRERYARDLARLFDIGRLGDLGRYALYRRTVFAEAREETASAFDTLFEEMHRHPDVPPARLPAMNRLLDSLRDDEERHALLRMVSPSADVSRHALLAVAGVRVLQHRVPGRTGEAFDLRDAVGAHEIGMLYDLFLRGQHPFVIGGSLQYLVLVDEWHRIVGGAGYTFDDGGVLSLELLIVDPAVRGAGLGAAMIDELLRRAADTGATQVRAPSSLRRFCLRMGFTDDPDNGDLRRAVV